MMDLPIAPGVEQVNVMKASQIGASECLRNLLGYVADCEPDPWGLTLPNREKGRSIVADRLIPLFRDTPRLRQLLSPRAHDLQKSQVKLDNGFTLHLMWSGSAAAMASDPMRGVVNDEVDKHEKWATDDADSVALTWRRLESYQDRKIQVNLSTPTTRDGRIFQLWESSTVHLHYLVPCPRCGRRQRLEFARLRWDVKDEDRRKRAIKLRRARVWYQCAHCGAEIEETQKVAMVRAGKWGTLDGSIQDAEAVDRWPVGTRIGMGISALHCLWRSWQEIAAEFTRAEGDITAMFDFRTNTLGEPFEQQVSRTRMSDFSARSAGELAEGIAPAWTQRLIATIDTQHTHFWIVIRAWGPGLKSQRVFHGKVESFADLDRLCFAQPWQVDGGEFAPLMCDLVLIDSGGTKLDQDEASRTAAVYQWAAPRTAWVRTVKGASIVRSVNLGRPFWRGSGITPSQAGEFNLPIYYVNTQFCNDILDDLIRRGSDKEDQERRERLWLLNGRDDEEYNRHLSNMHKTVVRRRGRVEYVWMPIHSGARTDLRDCEVYQIAGAYMAQVHLLPPQEQIDRLRQEIVDQKRRAAARNSPPSQFSDWTPRPL